MEGTRRRGTVEATAPRIRTRAAVLSNHERPCEQQLGTDGRRAVLFTGGAVAGLIAGENTGAVAVYFVVSTLVLVLLAAPWLVRNPPAINANTGTYLVLAVVLELGSLLGGAIESLRGLGAWVVLGIALAVYGWLERGRVIITSGVVAALAGVGAIAAGQPWLTISLQLFTAAVFATAAVRLRVMRVRPKAASR